MSILTPEEKEVFDSTQKHRMRIVDIMTEGGRYPVNDPDSMNLIVKLLSEVDKNQLNRAKIELQAKKDEDDKQNVALMSAILKNISYEVREPIAVDGTVTVEVPALPDNPDMAAEIRPEELALPKEMGEAELEYDQSDEEEGE